MPSLSRQLGMLLILATTFPSSAQGQIKRTNIQGRLLSPIDTRTSKSNDKFTLLVLSPISLKDGIIEGHVVQVQGAGRVKGKSELLVAFDTLTINNVTVPVAGEVRGVRNSKGVANVDEEGKLVGHSSKAKDFFTVLVVTAAAAGVGAAVGGKAAAVRAGAAGAAASTAVVFETKGPEIELAPGSEFTVAIQGSSPSVRPTPANSTGPASFPSFPGTAELALGISVTDLSPELKQYLHLPDFISGWPINGVVVVGVEPGGPANRRLVQNDVILAVYDSRVTGVSELKTLLHTGSQYSDVSLIVCRKGTIKRIELRRRID